MATAQKNKRNLVLTIEIPEDPATETVLTPANLRLAEITPSLYISSYKAVRDFSVLRHRGITHILNVSACKNLYEDAFTYCSLAMPDDNSAEIHQYIDMAVTFIADSISQGGKVLVHCFRGKSRAPTIACAYLMLQEKFSAGKAMKQIKLKQPHIRVNFGFMAQLNLLE